ncbi:MAG: hypothetical protein CMO55_00225 [Verrucomicrobiales bacterium]|nr:hypothetical protein [Verrucomicrobiales bacterium]
MMENGKPHLFPSFSPEPLIWRGMDEAKMSRNEQNEGKCTENDRYFGRFDWTPSGPIAPRLSCPKYRAIDLFL